MTRVPTVYDVATHAGVSIATVSRVFRQPDTVKEATRERVLASVDALGYVPSGAARGLAARRTGVIGLFFPGLDAMDADAGRRLDEGDDGAATIVRDVGGSVDTRGGDLYFDEVLRGSEVEAWRSGFVLMVGVGRGATAHETFVDMAGRVDGIIVLAGSVPEDEIGRLARRLPVVVMAGRRHGDEVDHVSVSNAEGMRALVGHLIDDLGVHELAYVAGSIGSPDDDERWQGFREALTERGLPAPDAPDHRGEFTREGGREGSWESDGALVRAAATLHAEDDDFGQPGTLYREVFDDDARARFLDTIAGAVGGVKRDDIRERAIQYWTNVDAGLGLALRARLASPTEDADQAAEFVGVGE